MRRDDAEQKAKSGEPGKAAGLHLIPLAVAVMIAAAVFFWPARYQVDGLSMAPGLVPGDVVATGRFPWTDRLRRPRRFERWILAAADGSAAIKRIVGLPGETVSILEGDLAIDGRSILAPPQILAETASAVPAPADDDGDDTSWRQTFTLPVVLDDAAFAPEERRILLPVRDVGLAATIHVSATPSRSTPSRATVRVGDQLVSWRFKAAGRYAVVAGRLDGHRVGVSWPIPKDDHRMQHPRSCLPPQPPAAWDIATVWPGDAAGTTENTTLILGLTVTADAAIDSVIIWRDILQRPAADGVTSWTLGPDAFFVLGDFPSGSRDSRHWGPLFRESLKNRVQPAP